MIADLVLFLILLKDSALALGGLGSLPLVRQDLVVPGRSTLAGQDAYRFRHELIRDAAYRSLPKEARAELHAHVAASLLATSVAPLVMIPATIAARRFLMTSWFAGLVRGAALATAGLLLSTGLSLIAPDAAALLWWQIPVAIAALALTYDGRLHPGVVVIGGALVGVALGG